MISHQFTPQTTTEVGYFKHKVLTPNLFQNQDHLTPNASLRLRRGLILFVLSVSRINRMELEA